MTSIEQYAKEGIRQILAGHYDDSVYHPMYKSWNEFRYNPEKLKEVTDYFSVGYGMAVFLDFNTIEDIDIRQQVASIAYLFLSLAIKQEDSNMASAYLSRTFLMIDHGDALQYTVSSILKQPSDFFSLSASFHQFEMRDSLFKMEYADIVIISSVSNDTKLLNKKRDIEQKIDNGFFGDGKNRTTIIYEGKELHTKLLEYLETRVFEEADIDF